MGTFKTVHNARADIISKAQQKEPFCPIIKEDCNYNCRCYNKPSLVKDRLSNGTIIWHTYNSYCSSPIISGYLTTHEET